MSYRYYSTQRPLWPGAFPRSTKNKVVDITNYDRRTFVEELGREAWGCIEYERPLDPEDARDYELVEAGEKRYMVQFLVIDCKGWDGTPEKYARRAKTVTLRGVTDVDAAVKRYMEKLPAGRYDVDDVKWRVL